MVSFSSLCKKDVINIMSGKNIGKVDDLEFSRETAKIVNLVVYGRLKCWGLFGREQDIKIKWKDVVVIGLDAILVNSYETEHTENENRDNNAKKRSFIEFD